MSEKFESFFDAVFGDGGPFEAMFGKRGKLDEVLNKVVNEANGGQRVVRNVRSSRRSEERARYQEALMTELLITLAGKGLLTNAEAKDVIAKAKERSKEKAEKEKAEKEKAEKDKTEKTEPTEPAEGHYESKPAKHGDAPCGGSCPLHDDRPHKRLECSRCKKVMPHLIEGEKARCRACLEVRLWKSS